MASATQKYIATKTRQHKIAQDKFPTFRAFTDAQQKFLMDLTEIQHRAMNVGLPMTYRAINTAVRVVGYELAGDLEEAAKQPSRMV
jgi:hypothetical protein